VITLCGGNNAAGLDRSKFEMAFSRSLQPYAAALKPCCSTMNTFRILTTKAHFHKVRIFRDRSKIPVGTAYGRVWMLADDGGWPPEST